MGIEEVCTKVEYVAEFFKSSPWIVKVSSLPFEMVRATTREDIEQEVKFGSLVRLPADDVDPIRQRLKV